MAACVHPSKTHVVAVIRAELGVFRHYDNDSAERVDGTFEVWSRAQLARKCHRADLHAITSQNSALHLAVLEWNRQRSWSQDLRTPPQSPEMDRG